MPIKPKLDLNKIGFVVFITSSLFEFVKMKFLSVRLMCIILFAGNVCRNLFSTNNLIYIPNKTRLEFV